VVASYLEKSASSDEKGIANMKDEDLVLLLAATQHWGDRENPLYIEQADYNSTLLYLHAHNTVSAHPHRLIWEKRSPVVDYP
jgi:hypothetical protein